ncbi:D-amino acid dehydrogenase small subunit [Prochlorococcus marinus str. MIT 9321]|uniref:D-amino acid dehydrogenase small subunit n=1 Tax=Prochlorococcus marinus str. MIT 9401 TaxID=167551 RepID=A0A0A2AXP5_PROMR|nr:FAD-dependent oxidoreductase [Prochlorococcus marinus]KGG03279.1 D-amino acid dehydrogenase small subunit [Prochlorococcus marinus str. MIT 9321]KGG06415.1 D-amino acid dehydrogenase small subunit [Prochlorococcus marinus str. MIT 9322]KGG06633.1 D-amino acid dehydrogenase small subunit [Prochlorococcus marinus str. MIT 9401]
MKSLKENFQKKHIVIIGSGIIGKFNALELSELGFQITIIDPSQLQNSSNAALGLLMGNMYQKRRGRSWDLRKQSIELWPKWIEFLQKFNNKLNIEKPLIQLTTNEEKFKKLKKFIYENNNLDLQVLERDSPIIAKINRAFQTNNIRGMMSIKDGKINAKSLLKTLDKYLNNKKINFLKEEIIKIRKSNKQWISTTINNEEIKSDIVILCNSLKAVDLIDNLSHNIKLKPVLGQAIEVDINDAEVDLLSLPKQFNIDGKNIIPKSKNKLIIGSTDENSTKPEENIFEKLTNFLDKKPSWLAKGKVSKKWFGIRSRPDGEPSPIMKNLEDGLIICTGFYKNGILLAPACSKWVANEIKKYLS